MKIVLAPIGAGKTERALQEISQVLDGKRFARVWVLLATERQKDDFRNRLVTFPDERNIYFNVEFFGFSDLNRRLLNLTSEPVRGLTDAARFALLRSVVDDLRRKKQLTLFSNIADKPGFIGVLADFINELKQNEIKPEDFENAVRTDKDRELANIYNGYQQTLIDSGLVDTEGEGWLALELIRKQPHIAENVDLLIVDGYDNFTPVQAKMLAELSEIVGQTLVTLTTVTGREDTVGRRFKRALETLKSHTHVEVDYLDNISNRHADLQHLIRQIFMPDAPQIAPSGGIQFIEMPDEATEVRAVLREVKRLILDGIPPDNIMIALRDWGRYQPSFVNLQHEYGVPLSLHYGERLVSNPMIAVFLDVLKLHENDFRRADVLDTLKSPYIQPDGMTDTHIALLERISEVFKVTQGRDNWLDAIKSATREKKLSEFETLAPILTPDEAHALVTILDEFFTVITPRDDRTSERHIVWLEELIGTDPNEWHEFDDDLPIDDSYSLNMIAALRQADERIQARDLLAMQALKKVLRGLLNASELLTSIDRPDAGARKWGSFEVDFLTSIDSARIEPQPSRYGFVLVTTATNARGLPHDYIFIPGLSEGLFPQAITEDRVYLDSERDELRRMHVTLDTMAERAADDGLYFELICLPRKALFLSRPAVKDGEPWVESHLWRATRKVFDRVQVKSLGSGEVVPVEDVASFSEASLTASDRLAQSDLSDTERDEVAGLVRWLQAEHGTYWRHIRTQRATEAKRYSDMPYDHHSGFLQSPELIDKAREKIDDRNWSASQFNEYGLCPFRFFSRRLLQLDVLEEPEEGMDNLQRGTLVHAILENTYNDMINRDMVIHPDNLSQTLEFLMGHCDSQLQQAPNALNFRPTALWEQEKQAIRKLVEHIVRFDFSEKNLVNKYFGHIDGERRPYLMEGKFGGNSDVPLEIPLDDVGRIRVNGFIDRIDRVGDHLVVIDYKTGSKSFKEDDMREGRNFQMIVYMLGAKALLKHATSKDAPKEVAGGFFWHVGVDKASGVVTLPEHDELIDVSKSHLRDYIIHMRNGDFSERPGKTDHGKCVSYCEYSQMCRLCGMNLRKDSLQDKLL